MFKIAHITLNKIESGVYPLAFFLNLSSRINATTFSLAEYYTKDIDKDTSYDLIFATTGIVRDLFKRHRKAVRWHSETITKPSVYANLAGNNFISPGYYITTLWQFISDPPIDYIDKPLFIKPNSPYKDFVGYVIDSKEAFEDLVLSTTDTNKDIEVFVTEAVNIKREYRAIVCNGMVVTASMYIEDQRLKEKACDIDTMYKIQESLSKMPEAIKVLPKLACVDFAEAQDGSLYLLEVNSIHCCGFYKCDLMAVSACVNTLLTEEKYSFVEDSLWLL